MILGCGKRLPTAPSRDDESNAEDTFVIFQDVIISETLTFLSRMF